MTDLATPASPTDHLIDAVERLGAGVLQSNVAIEESNNNIAESNKRIAELGRFGRHNRNMIRLALVSVALDIGLSVVLGFAFNNAYNASHLATKDAVANQESIVATCKNSNAVRADDVALWTHFITLLPPKSAAATIEDKKILDFVDATFAPRPC